MKKICCVFGAGEYYGSEKLPKGDFLAVSADGGYKKAVEMGVIPDIHVGDFDSLGATEIKSAEIIRLKPEKDDTDTLSAVKTAFERGCREFYFYGCTGGRSDHTFSNIQTIAEMSERGCRGFLIGNREIFTCIHCGRAEFFPDSSGYVSVFSLSDRSFGVFEKGLKYKLNDYTMTNGFPIGTSNEFIGEKAEISVRDGTLLIIYTDKAREIITENEDEYRGRNF